jgi:hypothetical protein
MINSLGEEYSNAADLIKGQLISVKLEEANIEIKHTGYQNKDLDYNSCGVWVLVFFERTLEYLNIQFHAHQLSNINQKGLMQYILLIENVNTKEFIVDKRTKYAAMIQEDIAAEEVDAQSTIIKYSQESINFMDDEDFHLPEDSLKLLQEPATTNSNKFLAKVLDTEEAKKHIIIIKENAHPPILGKETDQAKDERFVNLARASESL